MKVTHIIQYPIKGLNGLEHDFLNLSRKGIGLDRRYMIRDAVTGKFISQRENAILSQLQISEYDEYFYSVKYGDSCVRIPKHPNSSFFNHLESKITSQIWNDECETFLLHERAELKDFFSTILQKDCDLVWMQKSEKRDSKVYDVGFADASPLLMVSQSAVDLLNQKLGSNGHVSYKNFRPNIVFDDAKAHIEDTKVGKKFFIGDHAFVGERMCPRCKVPGIDPSTGIENKKINQILAEYRFFTVPKKGIYFGLYLAPLQASIGSTIQVSDTIHF